MGGNESKLPAAQDQNIISERAKQGARDKLTGFDPNKFNYGIAGLTDTGKSSLVNAIRGIDRGEPGAATVSYGDCTTEVTCYSFKEERYNYILIWDIPGCGVPKRPSSTYFADNGLLAFDCLIIMTSASLQEEELNFALEAVKNNIPVCFVGPKCDMAMEDRMKTKKRPKNSYTQRDVIEYLKEINKKFMNELEAKDESLKKIPYFFISNEVLYELITRQSPKVRFMENRLIDFLINTIKNQRHVIDEDYEDYGLENPEEPDVTSTNIQASAPVDTLEGVK